MMYHSLSFFFCLPLIKMDILPILIPTITSYIISTHCPYSAHAEKVIDRENQVEFIIREYVWPLLSVLMGFAWFFSKHKVLTPEKIASMHRHHKLIIDVLFLALTATMSLWIWLYSCEYRLKEAFMALIVTICILFGIMYMISSYTSTSLVLLTPLIVWLFFMLEQSGKQLHIIMKNEEATMDVK